MTETREVTPVDVFSSSGAHFAEGNASNQHVDGHTILPVVGNQQTFLFRSNVPKRVLGRSRFICCCVLTHDGHNSLGVAFVILAVVITFMIGVVPREEVYSYVIVSVFSLCALLSLLLSVSIDPGILPPLPPDPERRSQFITVNGRETLCKLCPTCHIVRPPRSTHCQFCDYCVDEFDHHCGLLGSCVAKRTFRFFGGFFFFTTALVLYVGFRSLLVVATIQYSMLGESGEERWRLAAALICLLVAALSCFLVLPLAVYYVCLACTNSTQKENDRERRGICEPNRDYHEGYCLNFLRRYCGPLGKSRVNKGDANRFV